MTQGTAVLPIGWVISRLNDVAYIRRESIDPQGTPNREFNYLSIGNIESTTGNLIDFVPTLGRDIGSLKLVFTEDDILYSRLRPYLNKVFFPSFDGISATDLIPLRPKEGIEKKYLGYFLRTHQVVEYANQRSRGVQLPRISIENLLALSVPVAPLCEQRRIVAKVETLFAESKTTREALDKIPVLLRRFRQSLFAKAFKGELTQRDSNDEPAQKLLGRIRQERKKERQSTIIKDTEQSHSSELPETWAWTTIGEVAEIRMGQSPNGLSYNQDGRGLPLLNGPTEFGKDHPMPIQWTSGPTKVCNKGDLLICVRGNTTGKMNWADQSYCIGRGLAAISTNPDMVEIQLLFHYLSKETEEIMKRTTGSTFPNLQSNQLRNLPYPLAPYREQKRLALKISEYLSLIDNIETSAKNAREQADKIDQAILAKAFRGELVSQDLEDEPSTARLQRIRAKDKS